jgi:hypothetical protein
MSDSLSTLSITTDGDYTTLKMSNEDFKLFTQSIIEISKLQDKFINLTLELGKIYKIKQ